MILHQDARTIGGREIEDTSYLLGRVQGGPSLAEKLVLDILMESGKASIITGWWLSFNPSEKYEICWDYDPQ